MAVWVTGDTHGDWVNRLKMESFPEQKEMSKDDFVIICGDFGIWDNSKRENYNLDWLENRSFITLFVSGNHEKSGVNTIARYKKQWWDGVNLTAFDWNGTEGPVGRSYDLFGDGSVQLINIPGHADGLFAVKLVNPEGKFVLLFSDGGYAKKSWEECIPSGIAADKKAQIHSLKWIGEQSTDSNCVESLANHDPDVEPHTIFL